MSPTSSSHTIDAPNSALTHRISPEHISKLMKHTTAVGCFINKQEGLLLRDVRPPSHTLSITVCVHYCTLLMLCEMWNLQADHTHTPTYHCCSNRCADYPCCHGHFNNSKSLLCSLEGREILHGREPSVCHSMEEVIIVY